MRCLKASLFAASVDDPFEIFAGIGPQLGILLVLGALAVGVASLARRQATRRPKKARGKQRPTWATPAWRQRVRELQANPPTAISQAKDGTVMIRGVLAASPQIGDAPRGRVCLWRNQVGASAITAVAPDVAFISDDTGLCALERLEQARVIAPREPGTRHRQFCALYVGDEIQVCGTFVREVVAGDEDPSRRVYGTLGVDGPLEVQLHRRPGEPSMTTEGGPELADTATAKPDPSQDPVSS